VFLAFAGRRCRSTAAAHRPAGEGQEHADLAVLDPAGGAGVLPLHTGRLGALLEEAGLVDDERAIGVGQVLHHIGAQIVADGVGVPVGASEQVLDAVGAVVAEVLGHLPAVLALGVAEQPFEIIDGPPTRFGAGEVRAQAVPDTFQFLGPAVNILRRWSVLGHGRPP
jgi:hypothetical protein